MYATGVGNTTASSSGSPTTLLQSGAVGGSGVTTGGSAGQSGTSVGGVDRHLFCNTGIITPICK